MIANSARFRPKPMVDCIHLLTTLLQSLSFQERLKIFNSKRSHKIYTNEISPPKKDSPEADADAALEGKNKESEGETEFEWRVRVVYRLYSLLFPQLSSSINTLVTNLEEEERQQGAKVEEEYVFFFLQSNFVF